MTEQCLRQVGHGVIDSTTTYSIWTKSLIKIVRQCSTFVRENPKIEPKTRRFVENVAGTAGDMLNEYETMRAKEGGEQKH